MKIEELKKDLYLGDYGEEITNYSSGYVCDIITKIANNNVDIHYYDLFEWAKNNFSIIEEANEELGINPDIIKQIQQGQFYSYQRDLYENLENIIKYYVFDYIQEVLEIEEITEEQLNELEIEIDFTDNSERLENINDEINEIFKNKE